MTQSNGMPIPALVQMLHDSVEKLEATSKKLDVLMDRVDEDLDTARRLNEHLADHERKFRSGW